MKNLDSLVSLTCCALAFAACTRDDSIGTNTKRDASLSSEVTPDTAVLVASNAIVDLGTLAPGSAGSVIITNQGGAASGPLTVVASEGITVTGCTGALAAGDHCALTITVIPTVIGAFSGTVTITADPGATSTLVIAVRARLWGIAEFAVSPTSIDLGSIPMGGALPLAKVTVTAIGALTDLAVRTSGLDVAIVEESTTCGARLAASESCVVTVRFLTSTLGSRSDAVVISGGGANGKEVTVPITAKVLASGGTFTIDPGTAQNLVTAPGTTSSPIFFQVSSPIDRPTGSFAASLTGPDAGEFAAATTCTVVEPLGTCTVSVVFTPVANRSTPAAALLTVTDTLPGGGSVVITLSGLAREVGDGGASPIDAPACTFDGGGLLPTSYDSCMAAGGHVRPAIGGAPTFCFLGFEDGSDYAGYEQCWLAGGTIVAWDGDAASGATCKYFYPQGGCPTGRWPSGS